MPALGVRKLAASLGVAPNSLYWYVKNKQDLVQGVVRLVLSDMPAPPETSGQWPDRLRAVSRWFRARLREHPHVIAAPAFSQVFPFGVLPFTTAVGTVLFEAGFEDQNLVRATHATSYHVVGFVALEVARDRHGWPTISNDRIHDLATLSVGEELSAEMGDYMDAVRHQDLDALFEFSMNCMIHGLEAELGPPAKQTTTDG